MEHVSFPTSHQTLYFFNFPQIASSSLHLLFYNGNLDCGEYHSSISITGAILIYGPHRGTIMRLYISNFYRLLSKWYQLHCTDSQELMYFSVHNCCGRYSCRRLSNLDNVVLWPTIQ